MAQWISLTTSKFKTFGYYLLTVGIAIGAFFYINFEGQKLNNPAMINHGIQNHEEINHLLHILLALAVVILTARAMGALFSLFAQPAVIGEVLGGILLGPSFLGRFAPDIYAFVLPPSAAPFLGVIAQIGVIFYMFVVGLELDLRILRKSGHATLAISHAGIIVPFVLGSLLALKIYKVVSLPTVPFTNFALFLGVSMSITAFPVLARILTDRKLNRTKMGTIILSCAAVDDVTAWCLLALVVSITQAKIGSAFATIGLTAGYIALMMLVGEPLVHKLVPWLEKFDRMTEGGVALFFIGLLLSALATEAIGIHAIFGAFLLGAITPHDSRVAEELIKRIQDLVQIMFLPVFFAFTGMRTQIGLLGGQHEWNICGMMILVAILGKFGGSLAAAKLTGLSWRNSAALGVLMNTRGLVELIVLNLGLDLHIISPTVFTMLVVMALVTTFTTAPLLSVILYKHHWTE